MKATSIIALLHFSQMPNIIIHFKTVSKFNLSLNHYANLN